MPSNVSQIPKDVTQEGGKVAKQVFEGLGEAAGSAAGQLTGKKPKKQKDPVEELQRRDEEFKSREISRLLANLNRIKEEEARLRQKREEEKHYWQVSQKERLAPPQIKRSQPAKVLPQVAKTRAETKVGWGAG